MRSRSSVIAMIAIVFVPSLCLAATTPPSFAGDPSSLDLIHEIDTLTLKSKPALQLPKPTKVGDEVEAEGRFCDEDAPDQCIRFYITRDMLAVGDTRDGLVLVDEGKTGRPQFAMPFHDKDDWLSGTADPISLASRPRADAAYRRDLSFILECVRRYPKAMIKTQQPGN